MEKDFNFLNFEKKNVIAQQWGKLEWIEHLPRIYSQTQRYQQVQGVQNNS